MLLIASRNHAYFDGTGPGAGFLPFWVGLLAQAWTADTLMATDLPQPRWAVPGVIPEGAALLAGPPEVGKSWLSLWGCLLMA